MVESEFFNALEGEFLMNSNPSRALKQKKYVRNQFDFYGLSTSERREIQKPFLIERFLPNKSKLEEIVKTLWKKPQREYQLFAQEFTFLYIAQLHKHDISLFEYMVANKSWWDTVDFVANKLIGTYFKVYPDQQEEYVKKWLNSNNIWFQRTALLFQLKYKKDLNTELLSFSIHFLLGSEEFFINKAIGWILREYSRTNPTWVIEFTKKTELNKLSKKEALRLIKNEILI